jgi:hypothetical protein
MRTVFLNTCFAVASVVLVQTNLRADQLEMQNGDRYSGKILSLSADTVIMQSEVLGKIKVPRKSVVNLTMNSKPATPAVSTNVSGVTSAPSATIPAPSGSLANTNLDLSASLHGLGANTNFIRQIREQMLAGSTPEASRKYDELVSGLMSGKLNLSDIRREAQTSADQLRALKRELGPEAGDALDMYLTVLDSFLKETAAEAATSTVAKPKAEAH